MMTLPPVLLITPLLSQSDNSEGSWTEPITGIKFLYILGGTFVMGSPSTEKGHIDFKITLDTV